MNVEGNSGSISPQTKWQKTTQSKTFSESVKTQALSSKGFKHKVKQLLHSFHHEYKIHRLFNSIDFLKIRISFNKKIQDNRKVLELTKKLNRKERDLFKLINPQYDLLMRARNSPSEDVRHLYKEMESASHTHHLPEVMNPKIIESEIKEGVCQGACVEVARKFIEKSKEKPLLEQDLIDIAEEFSQGVVSAGVVNQVVFGQLVEKTNLVPELDPIKDYINLSNHRLDPSKIFKLGSEKNLNSIQNFIVFHLFNKFLNSRGLGQHALSIEETIRKQFEEDLSKTLGHDGMFLYYHLSVKLSMSDHLVEDLKNIKHHPEFSTYFAPIVDLLVEIGDQFLLKQKNTVQHSITKKEGQDLGVEIRERMSPLVKDAILLGKAKYNIKKILTFEYISTQSRSILNKMGEKMHLKFASVNEKMGAIGQKDVTYLDKIKNLSDGCYHMTFKTGKMGHAMLLVVVDKKPYVWNPSQGLIRCDPKDPKKTLLEVMAECPPPDRNLYGELASKENHLIDINAVASTVTFTA